jgi:ankyrin repeat protein
MECKGIGLLYHPFLTLLYRFRWVFCQLETLRHCFPPNLRQFLNELPDSLDETYERILRGINKAQKEDARRLLLCLTVAARPLRVEELAELLAFDFQTTSQRGIPTFREDWRWNDEDQAVLSTCSSLITIVRKGHSRVVQFSHFSVKEYLTSPRLAQSRGDVSRFYVDLNAAHTILAQACLSTLLRLDEHAGNSGSKGFPLVEYAARHWVEHAQFEDVSSRVRDGMDNLFDNSKPHFSAWLRIHDMDERWGDFGCASRDGVGSPLYYAAFCGFYDLAERLIIEHPEQVNVAGGLTLAPLPAALSKRHFRVADLLSKHGAVVDVRDRQEWTPLYVAGILENVDIMRWLLKHGANASARTDFGQTSLHHAAYNTDLEVVQVLLEYNPDIDLRDQYGDTPLHIILARIGRSPEGEVVEILRRLLEHGANPNLRRRNGSTPLHRASSRGSLEVARLLLSHGANVDEQDDNGLTPFQVASSDELKKLLLEHGAVPPP